MILQKLPNWLLVSVFLLATNAGMINVMGLLTALHQSISHMTGNVSMLATAIYQHEWEHVGFLILVVACYVIGSLYSGYILGSGTPKIGRRYGYPLALVTLFIIFSWMASPYFPRYGLLWAATAMGVQNAMMSHYGGTIIRTTHLSGVLTDLGLAFGYMLRGLNVERRRLLLHGLILLGFLLGGLIATIVYQYWLLNAFLLPAILSFVMTMVYWIVYWRLHSTERKR
ncbi:MULTISPECIES: YoaK family protein [unclassified Acinetobacter]|uniref:YoaK family protein n=1 Tax=unclassified Acinetobacter TaxID=196816 RepID=UPI0035BA18F6